ncbi:hypothetical protein NUU61_009562 [Penicillium alfredii]|uniref:Uncharacterized protein n=1 Tax=Penicillium alfredii TaxID=1506179 RepID=A0A9W9JTH4_9EURO|nr:uncharacterized protein NUU61_009562 [Penicillium alfredii]KAJ5081298.1 hypothetical protein NUU61_009562 [Penicillium alfredii]
MTSPHNHKLSLSSIAELTMPQPAHHSIPVDKSEEILVNLLKGSRAPSMPRRVINENAILQPLSSGDLDKLFEAMEAGHDQHPTGDENETARQLLSFEATNTKPTVVVSTTPAKQVRTDTTPPSKRRKLSSSKTSTTSKSRKSRQNGRDKDSPTKTPRPIPNSWDTARPEDRLLVQLKDQRASWAEITGAWNSVTGLDYSAKSLSTRYSRIKMKLGAVHGDESTRASQEPETA